ncbi:MAG: ATPase domain-containing protein [Promethearchaeota archaeon]
MSKHPPWLHDHQVSDFPLFMKQLKEQQAKQFTLPTGCKNLDEILQGGFRSGTKYLIFGQNRTGKTQLCHQLCVQAFLLQEKTKITENNVLTYYFDAENTFRPERIEELTLERGLNVKKVLKTIQVSHVRSNTALLLKLKEVAQYAQANKILLLIIDSMNNHYRANLANEQESFLAMKSEFLNILSLLHRLTLQLNVIFIATAQITPNFAENPIVSEIPVGNNLLNHFFSEYLYLKLQKNNTGTAMIINSHYLPENMASYQITAKGITDS